MLKRHGCIRAMALGLLIFAPTLTSAQIQDEGFHELQRQEGVMVEEFDERAARPDNTQEYFTLDESTSKSTAEWMDPGTALEIFDEVVYETMAAPISLSLLKWVRHFKAPPSAHEAYNRRKHFGGWVNEPNDNDCHNVRAKILIRDSLRKVTYSETNPCVVSKGLWKDPYTGALLDDARRQIQIDHMVPLKHAYVSGGWNWKPAKRCSYANFMDDESHLIAVSGKENMRKGDRSPDAYMPPDKSYHCEYLNNWLKIKMTWKLLMFAGEADTILDLLKRNNCKTQNMKISRNELQRLRDKFDSSEACNRFGAARLSSVEP